MAEKRSAKLTVAVLLGLLLLAAGPAVRVTAELQPDEPVQQRTILVRLRPAGCLRAEVVRLGDVAEELRGAGSEEPVLRRLILGRAPAPGRVAIWTRDEVLQRLRRARAYDWRVDGPDRIYLTVDVETVTAEDLQRAVAGWLQRHFPELLRVAGTQLRSYLRRPLYVPRHYGVVRLEPALLAGAPFRGDRLRVDVSVYAGDRLVATLPVYLEQRRDGEGSGIVQVGFEAGGDLPEAARSRPILVHRRDVVRLVARSRFFTVTATGQALQDGRLGQFIRVRNLKSQRVVVGRVVDRGVVEVIF